MGAGTLAWLTALATALAVVSALPLLDAEPACATAWATALALPVQALCLLLAVNLLAGSGYAPSNDMHCGAICSLCN